MHVIGWIIVGALAGWIASQIVHRSGQGRMVNIALGLVGALVGGFDFEHMGGFAYEAHGFIVSTLVAVIGAVIVLITWNALKRR